MSFQLCSILLKDEQRRIPADMTDEQCFILTAKTSESMQPWFKQDQRKLQLLQASSPQLCFNLSQSIQVEPAVTIATHSTEPPDSVPDAGFTPSAALPPAEEDEEEEEEEEVEKECVSALQLVGGQSRTGSHHQTIWTVTDCFFVIGRLWL